MWRIKVLYHNGAKIFAPYKRVKCLFFHYWKPAFLLEYYDLDVCIHHTSYDSFFFGNCIGFYTEENARRYIKLYDDCGFVVRPRTEPFYEKLAKSFEEQGFDVVKLAACFGRTWIWKTRLFMCDVTGFTSITSLSIYRRKH